MIDPKDLYTMGIHESAQIDDVTEVQRVPGGWLYTIYRRAFDTSIPTMTTTFVPWNDDARPIE